MIRYCACGCGQQTNTANRTSKKRGHIKGQPVRFLYNHYGRLNKPVRALKAKSPEVSAWRHMLRRCNNPADKNYKDYGGRGISVKGKLLHFEGFLKEVGRKPARGMSIGRIDNNGHYEVGNVQWETSTEQCRNRRSTKLNKDKASSIRQERASGVRVRDLAVKYGVSQCQIYYVLNGKQW